MKTQIKNKTILTSVIVVLIAVLSLVGYKSFFKSLNKQEGNKQYTLIVRDYEDTYNKEYNFNTDKELLGEALDEKNIIESDNSGASRFVTTVDGIKADASKEEWWNLKINGENSQTGIDNTYIKNKDKVEFVLTKGW
ncbi:DUF4430 domain-containing protein [Clostridium weizhouense]|uniref:DUF4430 domain-containing protein n=1 Tax=Clostridium weizhouense TaxID=2859781 RepID=A0ABS7ART8_9CLOT|nr:DUF4430 domain-containing protein [Clostridium weizhouense]MBW6411382.1 DUF4430 domain-containing protein [Clostridium weizhouense]